MPEVQRLEGGSIKHDVAVPVSRVAEFISAALIAVERDLPGIRPVPFGHLCDGNIHFNLSQPLEMSESKFMALWPYFDRIVHDIVGQLDGTFAAEHGIGLLKRDDMRRYKSEIELDLMRCLKRSIDPFDLMNPGKIIPSD
ncbi:MAG TPA: FAD-linked oxidase C-terminal domain-containing protein [Xanthobacteraceae bacterium]|nr:FAD-linked oxidase C-terminal domain-containing protein [Xanthobacteraceae bacterium]